MLATGEKVESVLNGLAVIVTFGAIVIAGIISGIVAADLAGSGLRRRRVATVVSLLLMTASVASTLVLLDLAGGAGQAAEAARRGWP